MIYFNRSRLPAHITCSVWIKIGLVFIVTHGHRLTEAPPSGHCYPPKQRRETLQDHSWVFCCLSLALTSIISLARTIQMAQLTSWSQETWEAYLMRIIVPDTRRLCKDSKNKKNAETASKELQIWWRVNSIITRDTWYIPFWSHFSLELPQNQATIISRELSADRLDAHPPPRLGANLEKSLHLLCVLWTTPPLLTPSSLDQIWTWKTWELKNNLLICETSAIQDNSTTKFSPLRTSMNKATQKTPKSSQMLVGMSKATIRALDALCHPQSLLGQGMGDCLYLTAGNLALSWGSVFQGPISVLSNVVLGLIKSTYIRTSVPIHSDGQMPVGITVILRLWVSKPR